MRLIQFVILFSCCTVFAQGEIDFIGIPKTKISEGGVARAVDKIAGSTGTKTSCIITKVDDKYYWTTRQNTEMVKIISGAFVTYYAINGSGYVRATLPEMKQAVAVMGDTEKTYDYVEHLLTGLKSITYYGECQK